MGRRTIIDFRQGIWKDESGKESPLKALPDSRIKHIERWLRGCGATLPPEGLFDEKYVEVDCEMQRRGLRVLPDHKAAYLRDTTLTSRQQVVSSN